MKIVYCDESGDPGYPKFQSPCFILSFLYFNIKNWDKCFEHLLNMRRELRSYGLPTRLEFHSREFFLNKMPFYKLNLDNKERITIIDKLVIGLSQLSKYHAEAINIVINKNNIQNNYNVLDKAFTYGLTRIDTNLFKDQQKSNDKVYHHSKFMLLVDNGYIHKVQRISRKLYRFNYVPYKGSQKSRPLMIKSLIDDPLPKNSKNSYFIQSVDLIAYLVSQYIYIKIDLEQSPKRKKFISDEKILEWIEKLRPIFNFDACPNSIFDYGIFSHPDKLK